MATLNVNLNNASGDILLPATLASLVETSNGNNLGTVEAGAQVNVIETVKVNGSALTPTSKAVNVLVTMEKLSTATTGFAASYQLKANGSAVGDKIDIPKDLVVESGEVKTCTVADVPVEGYVVGDKYIDLVLANATDSHIYVLVSDLVDTYTQGAGISISNNEISNAGVRSISTGTTNGTINVNTNGTSADVAVYGLGSAAYADSTAFAASSHNQASNTINALTGYTIASSAAAISSTDTLNAALGKLEYKVDQKQGRLTPSTGIDITNNVISNTGVTAVGQGSANGTISVTTNGTTADVAVKGLGSAAYAATTDFSNSATTVKHSENTPVGSGTQPVYVASDGTATATTYQLNATVPPNAVFTDTTYTDMTGATSSAAGTSGLVPAPAAGDNNKYLKGDGTWATVSASGGGTVYSTCSTAAATAAKTATVTSGTFTLEAGASVTVLFSNANTATTPTLNVDNTGAKNIYHRGSQITDGQNIALLSGAINFVYDGTQYHLIGNYLSGGISYRVLS